MVFQRNLFSSMSKPHPRISNLTNPIHFLSGNASPKSSEIITKKGMRLLSSLSTLDLGSFKRDKLASF